ncbi:MULTISPECIES: TIGR01906 family membrane protein [Vagococcus]|uniref:COG4478, integral membrane protein n=1 Tax=Vagococcus fluvialis bH819 TaxID=1255619 RepID=A0A1X6WSD0_9ENTE|nr:MULTISPECIES: TIGR01906 family membrane protein [Vagococcus]SLM87194.1 COG4478, integral membrane protein [Vagococcus fluvialis bH819]HCM90072.1 TIGR01906 family membrane protein [Vagococcus sp.]
MEQIKKYVSFVSLVLFLLTLAIALTINARWLYVMDINRLEILDYIDLSKHQLLVNYDQLMHYLNLFWVNPLKMSDFPVSETGAFHFYEVKRLFQINYGVLIITIVPSVIYLKNLLKRGMFWQLIKPFTYILTGLIMLVFFMAVGFDTFFVKFHEVFFNNDAWVFNPMTDPVILALPQDYFMHCFILFFILFIMFILIVIFIGKKQLKKIINTKKEEN